MELKENMTYNRIIAYILASKEELAKVLWPPRSLVINHALIVIALVIFMGLFLGGLDLLFTWGIRLTLERF